MSQKQKQSQEDIFLELKLIAFRKKLEEENETQLKVNEQKKFYELEKSKTLSHINYRFQDNLKQSLPFAIPIGLGSMFWFKSILIFPITLGVGYCVSSLYNNIQNKNQVEVQK